MDTLNNALYIGGMVPIDSICIASEEQKYILLVEDEAIIAMAESLMLQRNGFTVETAGSGEIAIDIIEKGRLPDLVLMDIDLGRGIDGTETARIILSRWEIPIVFLTSHNSREMVEKVRGITRYGYITKNSGEFVIISTIEMAIELFQKECAIKRENFLLQRIEETADIGYWFIHPETSVIRFSEGSRKILGIASDHCSFEEFDKLVLSRYHENRAKAFNELISNGTHYDMAYRIKKNDSEKLVPVRSSGRKFHNMIIGVLQDISEIEDLLSDLREREQRQAVTLRSIGDGVISTDVNGKVIELNKTAEQLTGWSNEEASGHSINDVFNIKNAITGVSVENPIEKVLTTGTVVGLANHTILTSKDNIEHHIADSAAPILDDNGEVLGMVLIFRDVTREYLKNESIRKNEEIFRTLFHEAHTPMMLIEPLTGGIEEVNHAAENFYGWDRGEFTKLTIFNINTAAPEEIRTNLQKTINNICTEFRFTHRTSTRGKNVSVHVISGPVDFKGEKHLLSIILDASRDQVIESKDETEKERINILLKDASHRMKNSLQIISSLIQFHLSNISDKKTASALWDLQNRVNSIILVYEYLIQNNNCSVVSSAEYIELLLQSIRQGYINKEIILKSKLQDFPLREQFALSLGLILNELIINAVKYAFIGETGGTITVIFSGNGGSEYNLVVTDDGNGFNQEIIPDSESGKEVTGLRLVRSLVKQEKGTMEIDSDPKGTKIYCRFPMPQS